MHPRHDDRTATVQWSVPKGTELAVLVASPRGTSWRLLPEDHEVDVGRAQDAFISLDDEAVSRRHLRIVVSGGAVRIEDLGSKNGTTLDGRSIAPRVSEAWPRGSCVVLGNSSLMLQSAAQIEEAAPLGDHAIENPSSRWDAMVERIAEQDVPVLILGETGTGKEVTAERVHRASPRRDGPLVKVHPASIAAGLLESELFGHERGAFTGAHRSRAGLIERAEGGTLFIDEVGELSPEAQMKLLRVLEDRVVRRVGGDRDKEVDFRLVAATHRELEEEMQRGSFRADLYFRLSTFTIRLAALRDRGHEIEPLARRFVDGWAETRGVASPAIAKEALEALSAYHWPGNVRELKAVMERAAIVSDGPTIRLEDLPLEEMRRRTASNRVAEPETRPPSDPKDEERERIIVALQRCGGNQTRAAELLGISRRTLVYRLDALDIPRPQKGSGRKPQ